MLKNTTTSTTTTALSTSRLKKKKAVRSTKEEKKVEEKSTTPEKKKTKEEKELERIVNKLERVDIYGFFSGPPLEQFMKDEIPFNLTVVQKRIKDGYYDKPTNHTNTSIIHKKESVDRNHNGKDSKDNNDIKKECPDSSSFDWKLFWRHLEGMCRNAIPRDTHTGGVTPGTLTHASQRLLDELQKFQSQQEKVSLQQLLSENNQPAMQGTWRRNAFPERQYQFITDNVPCSSHEDCCSELLSCDKPNGFYNPTASTARTTLSEQWMTSIQAPQEDIFQVQVKMTMEIMLHQIQDVVMTQTHVLSQPPVSSSNGNCNDNSEGSPLIREQAVWGMDCYTRTNVHQWLLQKKTFSQQQCEEFITSYLVPAMNAVESHHAHDMTHATQYLCQQPSNPSWVKEAALCLERAVRYHPDGYRIHPKGHGSVLLSDEIPPNSFITQYLGEVYPLWRWGEKNSAIEYLQDKFRIKPKLPDFYNMAFPNNTVVVDASRKAGLGSSFSHSCQPTCHVKSAVMNGQWTLAITSLRTITKGEELTFDYHAVTESLQEYQAAICLCGQCNCRGSFLHFATADCYQSVLRRNSPLAVRFASLAKGSLKQTPNPTDTSLLSQYDLTVNNQTLPVWLRTYTADTLRYIEYERKALPIALIHNHFTMNETKQNNNDDAITTKKVELSKNNSSKKRNMSITTKQKEKKNETTGKNKKLKKNRITDNSKNDEDTKNNGMMENNIDGISKKSISGWKPESAFFYYSKQKKETFVQKVSLSENMTPFQMNACIQKIAGSEWKLLSQEEKQYWKDQAHQAWIQNDGPKKAKLEEERKEALLLLDKLADNNVKKRKSFDDAKTVSQTSKKKCEQQKEEKKFDSQTISLEAADGEGYSAIEQRIHQLTQTLGRVDRVFKNQQEKNHSLHSPITIMKEKDILDYLSHQIIQVLWTYIETHQNSLLPSLYTDMNIIMTSFTNNEKKNRREVVSQTLLQLRDCIIQSLQQMMNDTKQYNLDEARKKRKRRKQNPKQQQKPLGEHSTVTMECSTQSLVTESSFDSIQQPLDDSDDRASIVPNKMTRSDEEKIEEDETSNDSYLHNSNSKLLTSQTSITNFFKSTPQAPKLEPSITSKPTKTTILIKEEQSADIILSSEQRPRSIVSSKNVPPKIGHSTDGGEEHIDETKDERPLWMKEQHKFIYKLQTSADVLLFYAHTSTFFQIQPYESFESSPIEVYARELGNSVPKSILKANRKPNRAEQDSVSHGEKNDTNNDNEMDGKHFVKGKEDDTKSDDVDFFEPDDIVTKVTVKYPGDYVLSILLQWYTGGVDLKPGLPNMKGCISLPTMKGCWCDKDFATSKLQNNSKAAATDYEGSVRPILIDWFEDRVKRGSPWPEEISRYFEESSSISDSETFINNTLPEFIPMGSPVLDFLVAGDDSNIQTVIEKLKCQTLASNGKTKSKDELIKQQNKIDDKSKSTVDRLQSTVDEGMPAQAVANWVQCENPKCLKWRKLPWHVDLDLLPEKFFCKDNQWNPDSNSCHAPEDPWDECDAPVKFSDSSTEVQENMFTIGCEYKIYYQNQINLYT